MNRRVARLRAVQVLYQLSLVSTLTVDQAIESTLTEEEESNEFFLDLVKGTLTYKEQLDHFISQNLKGYTIDRLGHVDRSIVRMALYEMLYIDDIEKNISLNEAIELAKAFGGQESGRFMNGVLSGAYETALKDR
ncbi:MULTISPECIES: transcription antitermination factor NusB [Shouchella]|uniref:Transcription antitermination protein NusB n=3 Tax=Bacillaceae TaxID=186817 RepID=A0A060LUT4_9BACI|nr:MULTISPECIES: transcription antitermination factor NusB [Bacillaceae]RQW20849.1 transcription antitermination factor NusB [Bacillus sp. C1-1]AIC95021.1 N utilization substance protein B-like protein [Shouchella lehensis G1]KQL57714.1 antitermination protein NusB [Alkalicoccobacillus plakortidis]MBG9784139.1 antitermination protein NusB [Shouchella lehensis]TES50873.1 transcription antitermination factor NusB [Shouchella lehensis]